MSDPLDDLRGRFTYLADVRDRWTVLDAPTGPLWGDCDDFALTALWLLAGRSWLRMLWLIATFQACMWRTRTGSGLGHMMLWVRGSGWICNIYPTFGDRKFPLRMPLVLPFFLIGLIIKASRK